MTTMPTFLLDFGYQNSGKLQDGITNVIRTIGIQVMRIAAQEPVLIIIRTAITIISSITSFAEKMSLEARHSA